MASSNGSGSRSGDAPAESQYEAYLNSKREAVNRMKAGKKLALGRLEGQERQQDRSLTSELSDERDASIDSTRGAADARDARIEAREGSSSSPVRVHDFQTPEELNLSKVVEIFTAIEKRRWDETMDLLRMFPKASSMPCPKNLVTAAKGNLMLHEASRNCPPLPVIAALLAIHGNAARSKGGKGYLPLHYACATGASFDVVQKLLDAYPAAIRTRDTNDLMIPLHFACKWGAATEVIEMLVKIHPEAKQVRDIYAKTPSEYAAELGEERSAVLASLGRSGSDVSSINLNEEAADSNKHLQRELASTKAKVEKLSSELNERERKFALLYGAEKEKVYELEQQKEQLENDCLQAKILQDEQTKKLELLEQEYKTLKALHETHSEKKAMLEAKIDMLEQERLNAQQAIGNLEAGANSTLKQQLTTAMMDQEAKYKSMLQKEQERIQDLEKRAREAELTHRHYTMALLQEHEKEVSKFEELTARFKVLEGQLRREIENERTKRVSVETELNSKDTDYQQALHDEQQKVAFLEDHITKVNDLLEAEQKRFFELEGILKDTLSLENEQREEIEAEFKEKENRYKIRIENETVKRQHLEEAYSDVATKLKSEVEKTAELQAYEIELKKELEADHARIEELLKFEEESKAIIESEQEKAKKAEEAEAEIRALLKAEQAQVEELESSHEKIHKLLQFERENAAQLREELNQLQVVYEKEMKKVRDAVQAESSARSELRSLHDRVSSMEDEESSIKKKAGVEASKLEMATKECALLKSMLDTERDRVATLTRSQEELRDLLDDEKQKVKILEKEQVVTEFEVEEMKCEGATATDAMETKLVENQKSLVEQRKSVTNLEQEYEMISRRLESELTSVDLLERKVNERDALLEVERQKFGVLLKEHADTEAELEVERRKVDTKQTEIEKLEALLQVEMAAVQKAQKSLDQAAANLEIKIAEVTSLEEDEKTSRQTLEACMKELELSNEEISKLTESLKVEKQRAQELDSSRLEMEEELKQEKDRVVEYEHLLEAQKNLSMADQSTIQQLEGQVAELQEANALARMDVKAEEKKQEQSRQATLFEAEQNKVKALEHSCEQIMSLLEWEKKHVLSLKDRQNELERELEDNSEELAATKKTLEETEKTVDELELQLVTFEGMKREIIRLNAAGQQKDILLAAMLEAIGDARVIKGKAPVQRAALHVNDLQRIVGLDLAGLDYGTLPTTSERSLVAYDDSASRRRIMARVVLPLIPIGGLIAYHQHDPTLLRNLSANLGEYSSVLRDDIAWNLGEMTSELSSNLRPVAAQVSELASRIDTDALREPLVQAFGIATRRINVRRV